MLSHTFIKKTLLDLGEMKVSVSSGSVWQIYAHKMPLLKANLRGFAGNIDAFDAISIEFESTRFQTLLKSARPHLSSLKTNELTARTPEELEKLCDGIRLTMADLPADFDPDDSTDFDPELDRRDTESEALEKKRRGQARYRKRLEQLWQSRCAVTGVAIAEVLRASHAKPWAECETGRERLDPYNGFLLSANLDALFDKFLISFDDDGSILIAPSLDCAQLSILGIDPTLKLRFVQKEHLPYLAFHRKRFYLNH